MQNQVHEIIKKKHLLYLFIILISSILSIALLLFDGKIILGVVIVIISSIFIIKYPIIGLIEFIILSFIRPTDIYPALQAIPLAKLVGGLTLVAIVIKNIRTRDFILGSKYFYLLLGFALTLFISIPLSYWPSTSLQVSIDFLKIILFYLIFVNIVKKWSYFRTVSIVALLCILVLCFSTIQTFLAGNIRAFSIIGGGLSDANDVALIMVTAIPFAAYWKIGKLNKYSGLILYWSTITFLMVGIILTQSRGGFLGLGAVMFSHLIRGRNKILGIFAFVFIIALILLIITSEFSSRYSTIGNYEQDASSMGRIYAWKAGINMMISRPFTGVGIGSFEIAFGTDFRPAGFTSNKWMAPHNTLVQVGGETGLLGLGIFMYLYFLCLYQINHLKPAGGRISKERISKTKDIIFSALIGYGVCAFFLTQALSYILYFLIASTVSIIEINRRQKISFENKDTDLS